MFEALAEAIDELEIPPYGDAIAEAIALRDRLDAAIAEAVGRFDAGGGWQGEGATSMTAWLRHRGGQTGADAARLARSARRLRRLPMTRAAYRNGELSGGQVTAILANLSDKTVDLFASQERELLAALVPLDTADLTRAMQLWRQRAEATLDDEEAAEPERELHHSQTLEGRWATNASWDPYGGGVIDEALDKAMTPEAEGEPPRSFSQRRADAMLGICQFFMEHSPAASTRRRRPDLDVVINIENLADGIGSLVGGPPLDVATIKRLLCDAGVHRVITEGGSSILDYGRTTRTIPPHLWAALVLRDRHCRHPSCDRGPQWCEAHHVRPWSQGGPTELANLVMGCGRHHHLWHLTGWNLKLLPDGEFHVTTPDGRDLVSRPPPLT